MYAIVGVSVLLIAMSDVDDARDMRDKNVSIRLCFADFIFGEVSVLGSFVGN